MVNLIAAGEVIERPASVVKELVENSIDAGATAVTVTIEDGGRKLISVSDNGSGMDADDLATAFEPHATSKVKEADDLNNISTLGFRGEALASIASVAQVRAVTRTPDSDQAHCLEIDCGDKGPVVPCSGDVGTTIQVRDLFYKTPARRKFLRTANTELGHITEQFARIALPQGHLDLALIHNGRELYRLSKTESLKQRVGQLFPMLVSGNERRSGRDRDQRERHPHPCAARPARLCRGRATSSSTRFSTADSSATSSSRTPSRRPTGACSTRTDSRWCSSSSRCRSASTT